MSADCFDILEGLDVAPLATMSQDQLDLVARLMARSSERAYRRGVQQGATIAKNRPGDLPENLHDWRYGASTDLSPWADANRAEASLDRLYAENRGLRFLCFPLEIPGQPSGIRVYAQQVAQ
jgi:hypothetical protein